MAVGRSGHATELPSKAMSAPSPCMSRPATERTRSLEDESTSRFQMPLTVAACSSSSGPESGSCDMTRGLQQPHATPPARRHPALAAARTRTYPLADMGGLCGTVRGVVVPTSKVTYASADGLADAWLDLEGNVVTHFEASAPTF